MRAGRITSIILPLLVLLASFKSTGCISRFDSYSRVQKLRADYSAIWQERSQRYRGEIDKRQVAKPAMDRTGRASAMYFVGLRQGAVSILDSFNEFRRSEPVFTAAVSWLKQQYADRVAAIQSGGLDEKELVELLRNSSGAEALSLPDSQIKSIAQNVGAITEIQLIYVDLLKFTTAYAKRFHEDKKDAPPASPPPDYNAIMLGVEAGVRAATGR